MPEKEENVIQFKKAAGDWLEMLRPQIRESTEVKYQNLLGTYILPSLGEQVVGDITQNQIETFCNALLTAGGKEGRGLSPKTVADSLSVVRSILYYSSKNGQPVACDAHAVRIRQPGKEMRVLSRREQNQLCQYIYSDINARNVGILISLYAGLRVGEVCALQWEDILLPDHLIYVHRTMQRLQMHEDGGTKTRVVVTEPKSSCSVRRIPIPDELIRLISEVKQSETGYFLTGSSQKYVEPRTLQNHFKRVLKMCSIAPANYHSLRHTFATRCVELGFDVKSLSEILGHASVGITMDRYVHPTMELKMENMQRLSTLLASQ